MKNIANGHGFVYQQNGENVEGFTSLLWTLIGSLLYLFMERIHIPLLFLNVSILFYLLIQYRFLFNKITKNSDLYFLFFTLTVLMTSGFLSWNIFSLLETCLWTVLINLLVIDILKTAYSDKVENRAFIILVILLIFTRPEALLLSFYFVICKSYFLYRNNRKHILKHFTTLFLPVIFATVILYIWRYYNFGVLFPNTYYAKVSGNIWQKIDHGLSYNILFFKENPLFAGILLFSFLYFIASLFINKVKLSKIEGLLFLFCTILFSILIPCLVGGDHFGLYRFMQPYIPLYIILFLCIIDHLKLKKLQIILILVFAFIFHVFSGSYNIFKILYTSDEAFPSRIEWDIVKPNRDQAKELNQFFPTDKLPSIGVLAAGAYAYYYQGRSVDLLGLNNVKMAHAPKNPTGPKNHASFNKEIFYLQKPDIILANAEFVKPDNPASKDFTKLGIWESQLLKNIQNDAKFKKLYANCIILNKKKNLIFKGYIRKDYISNILRHDSNYYIKQK